MAKITFVYPHKTKPVTVTGPHCALNCAHCGGHYLKSMLPVEKIPNLKKVKSLLISGGCTKDGKVPWLKHAEFLADQKGNLKYNFHVGLIDDDREIDLLAQIADTVSFDFVVDDETIAKVYHLNKTGEDYLNTYRKLKAKVPVLPHITIGLLGGEIKGEFMAIKALGEFNPPAIVFIIFRPTPNTGFFERKPPEIAKVTEVFEFTHKLFPDTPLYLGCMRPGGKYREEVDLKALELGFARIVQPHPEVVKKARELGFEIEEAGECCVL
ncbi:hypothetical protein [Carboxydothermus pertinax]|uniref:Elp3/MiaA/NifB-like radical SAM core domain-containing protein n=1 Tax=Carboxydothermus pertinax TaxID=870242 RepID=A0A1L8CWS5_9THEO|nr:hypothetical protein [Carboxydothermus pertinax]GAV23360.1 hypothetical protein cpu_18700 [Carboxydothermus pertinax]